MVQLFGKITENAIVNEVAGGKTVINFSIALNDDYKDKEGNKVQQVTFIRCAYWTKNTGFADFLTKGKQVEVFARLFPTAYTNKEGKAIGNINATANRVKLHGGGTAPAAAPGASYNTTAADLAAAVDDLPF